MIIHFIYFMVIYIYFRAFFVLRIKQHSNVFLNLISHGANLPRQEHGIKIISNSNGRKERTKRDRAEESANYKHY